VNLARSKVLSSVYSFAEMHGPRGVAVLPFDIFAHVMNTALDL